MSNNHNHSRPLGLKERIKAATSADGITALLAEGATYSGASETTKRAWQNAAARRTIELTKK